LLFSHATLGAYKLASKFCKSAVDNWEYTGQAKIALKVNTELEIYELLAKAKQRGLVTYLVEDAGRTQIAAGSKTVLAIGPAPVAAFNEITTHLKLL
jgi:peptidyl-tRNA hydrolase